ncbi:MAG TPA: response regulator [Candidatus Acidoferrales bacterium]|nr:response regulator [Candidatus Acidoferrales bacterium]
MSTLHNAPPTILLAGEGTGLRATMQDILRLYGYRVICAPDAEAALETIAANPIDLALFEAHASARSEFSACRAIKSHPDTCRIPVVFVVGASDDLARIDGTASGADDFLSTPIRKQELLSRVNSLLRRRWCEENLEKDRARAAYSTMSS